MGRLICVAWRGISRKESPSSSLLICREGMSIAAIMEKLQTGEIFGLLEALNLAMSNAQVQNTRQLEAAALVIMNIRSWAFTINLPSKSRACQ